MRRRHWFELHEQPWFPSAWRKMFQAGLGESQAMMGAYEHVAPKLEHIIKETGSEAILDLCSGSARVAVDLHDHVDPDRLPNGKPKLVLSDLYPNHEEFEKVKSKNPDNVDYYPDPVNAFHPPGDCPGVRTMLAAFHHFRPDDALKILSDAAHNADGILILEGTTRTWLNAASCLILPLPSVIVGSTRLRPWSPWHVLWHFFIPVLPIVAFWDGLVSTFRTYSVQELKAMTESIDAPGFQWEVGTLPMSRAPMKATYLMGWRPRLPSENDIS